MALCIDTGADVDATSTDGYTPLHYAARAGSAAAVEQLVAANATINVPSFSDGCTPFYLAAITESVPLMRTMLDLGADATIPDGEQLQPWLRLVCRIAYVLLFQALPSALIRLVTWRACVCVRDPAMDVTPSVASAAQFSAQ